MTDSKLPPLPRGLCTYADHSYPAYSAVQMTAYALAALAGSEAASVVKWLRENTNEFGAGERIENRFPKSPSEAPPAADAWKDPFDCQEFHELCMNYRGAHYPQANSLAKGPQWHYEQLQAYCRRATRPELKQAYTQGYTDATVQFGPVEPAAEPVTRDEESRLLAMNGLREVERMGEMSASMRETLRAAIAVLATPPAQPATKPFGYWHAGATEEESDFFLASESGDVRCENCIAVYDHPPAQPEAAQGMPDSIEHYGLIDERAGAALTEPPATNINAVKGHPLFMAGYDAGMHDAKLSYEPHYDTEPPATGALTPGYHALRNVIETLRASGSYSDEEGEATNHLADLLDTLARQSGTPEFTAAYMKACEGHAPDHNEIGLHYFRAAWQAGTGGEP